MLQLVEYIDVMENVINQNNNGTWERSTCENSEAFPYIVKFFFEDHNYVLSQTVVFTVCVSRFVGPRVIAINETSRVLQIQASCCLWLHATRKSFIHVFPQLTEHILLFLGAHVKSSYIRVQCDMLVFETSPPTHTHTSSFDYPFLLF